jgi:hypothetical protein
MQYRIQMQAIGKNSKASALSTLYLHTGNIKSTANAEEGRETYFKNKLTGNVTHDRQKPIQVFITQRILD